MNASDDTQTARSNSALREQVRERISRFARIRAAHRALPIGAGELDFVEERDRRADALRGVLRALAESADAATETPDCASPVEPDCALAFEDVDAELDAMETDLRGRVDRTAFSELRASIPRVVDANRSEGLALLDCLVGDPSTPVDRLAKLEYLITILSTEDVDGARKIVHDPASLSEAVTRFTSGVPTSEEAEAVSMEFYQAAGTDRSSEDLGWLRMLRDRKRALGSSRFAPDVLRAVVTYNARAFNRLVFARDSSREADGLLESLVATVLDESAEDAPALEGVIDESDEIWDRIGVADSPASVFQSEGLESIVEALRRRLDGIPIGSCSSERVAMALDVSRLEEAEKKAIRSPAPDATDRVLRATAIVGLVLRDLGIVRAELPALGIDELLLRRAWVVELDESFGRLVKETVRDPSQYALASSLSGIKTQHLLAPLAAIRDRAPSSAAGDPAAQARPDAAASGRAADGAGPRRAERGRHPLEVRDRRSDGAGATFLEKLRSLLDDRRQVAVLCLPVVLLLAIVGTNRLTADPAAVAELDARQLASVSPYLDSAYRDAQGKRDLLIGRLDADYAKLSDTRRHAVALEVVERLGGDGVREIMMYGPRGRLWIHAVGGTLRRPRS